MAKPAQSAKQQTLDKINDVDTVLVAVNSSPSVDELSAALGATLALNKLGKHATAVFSGEIPMAIEFLEPGKTFENTVDSLRDFIVALDKEKADHLRYKVDGDMVKIFITPYRTTINEGDFEFSQGDYNVEMVLAIGVRNEDDLDRALTDHGRIMHDAAVVGISIGADASEVGSITWHDRGASSYSELLTDLIVKAGSGKGVLDEQISTALLTGIVAATDRFSNERTTSNAMTLAAQLMSAGANQQLIATKLEQAEELSKPAGISMSGVTDGTTKDDADNGKKDDSQQADDRRNDGSTKLGDDVKAKVSHDKPKETIEKLEEKVKDVPNADGSIAISHNRTGDVDEVAEQVRQENQRAAAEHAEDILAQSLASSSPAPVAGLSVTEIQNDLAAAASGNSDNEPSQNQPAEPTVPADAQDDQPATESVVAANEFIETPLAPPTTSAAVSPDATTTPSFGGTLNATSEQAAADKRLAEANDRNKMILSHDGSTYVTNEPAGYPAVNSFNDTDASAQPDPSVPLVPPASTSSRGIDIQPPTAAQAAAPPQLAPLLTPTATDASGSQSTASDAMAEALNMASPTSAQQQHVPDVTALPPLPSVPQVSDPSIGGLPPLPPMPDFSTLPQLPQEATQPLPTVAPQNQGPIAVQPQEASPADPAAFQIPTQG